MPYKNLPALILRFLFYLFLFSNANAYSAFFRIFNIKLCCPPLFSPTSAPALFSFSSNSQFLYTFRILLHCISSYESCFLTPECFFPYSTAHGVYSLPSNISAIRSQAYPSPYGLQAWDILLYSSLFFKSSLNALCPPSNGTVADIDCLLQQPLFS